MKDISGVSGTSHSQHPISSENISSNAAQAQQLEEVLSFMIKLPSQLASLKKADENRLKK